MMPMVLTRSSRNGSRQQEREIGSPSAKSERKEAVHYAKHSLGWSAYLNGMQEDYEEFSRELEQVAEHMSEKAEAEPALV